jgi:hypothetical protein
MLNRLTEYCIYIQLPTSTHKIMPPNRLVLITKMFAKCFCGVANHILSISIGNGSDRLKLLFLKHEKN